MSQGYYNVVKENQNAEWYRTREICWLIYRANSDPKTAVKTREEFMPIGQKPVVKRKINTKKLQQLAAEINAKLNNK